VTNEVLVNVINVMKVGSGIGVIGVYAAQDGGKHLCYKTLNTLLTCPYQVHRMLCPLKES
jgi:hypothetical protein